MASITFFAKAQLNADYTFKSSDASKSITFGGYDFILTGVKPVHGAHAPSVRHDFLGYEETYSNEEISQEETDRIMHRYLNETGQAKFCHCNVCELKEKRGVLFSEIARLRRELQEGPMHWREEYQRCRIAELREQADYYGVRPDQSKRALIDAFIAAREAELLKQINEANEQIRKIGDEIKSMGQSNAH